MYKETRSSASITELLEELKQDVPISITNLACLRCKNGTLRAH